MPGRVTCASAIARAIPKSTTLTPPSAPIRTLPGLMSRWIEAPGMGRRERPGDARPDPGGLAGRERAAPAQDRGEVLAIDELHDDVRPARVLAVVVDGDDVRVAQRGGRLGLLPEAGREIGVAEVLGAKQLQGDIATEPGIGGAIDGRHAAAAQQFDQSISAPEDLPDLRQIVPSVTVARCPPDLSCAGIVPHEPVGQSLRPWRYARNSVPRSGRARAISTEALSQPIVVPASYRVPSNS